MSTELTGTQKQVFEKEKNRRDRLSNYLYDLSKLTFAGTIIANIPLLVNGDPVTLNHVVVVSIGIAWTYVFGYIANRILTY